MNVWTLVYKAVAFQGLRLVSTYGRITSLHVSCVVRFRLLFPTFDALLDT